MNDDNVQAWINSLRLGDEELSEENAIEILMHANPRLTRENARTRYQRVMNYRRRPRAPPPRPPPRPPGPKKINTSNMASNQNVNALINEMFGHRGRKPGFMSRAGAAAAAGAGAVWNARGIFKSKPSESLEQKKFRLQAEINKLKNRTNLSENEKQRLVNLQTQMIGLEEVPTRGFFKNIGRFLESRRAALARTQQQIKNLEAKQNKTAANKQALQNAKAREAGLQKEIKEAVTNVYNFSNQAKAYNSIQRYKKLMVPSQAQRNAFIKGILTLNRNSNRETLRLLRNSGIKNAQIKKVINTKLGYTSYSSSSGLGGLEKLLGLSSSSSRYRSGRNIERLASRYGPTIVGALAGGVSRRAPPPSYPPPPQPTLPLALAAGPSQPSVPIGMPMPMPQPPAQVSVKVVAPQPTPNQRSLVANAGGPQAIKVASNALKQANGNIPRAMNNTGLPRETFENVKKLGGVNIAPRIAMTIVRRRKTHHPVIVHRRHTAVKRRRTTTKKKVVACPLVKSNRIKKVLHKIPRKTLENFVASWALRR